MTRIAAKEHLAARAPVGTGSMDACSLPTPNPR